MEFGLRKIILIDSYVEGRASEIDVSGHTNISGDNGIGKTSFLKLIPIFYGEHPRRLIVENANGNEGFNQFYLPRNGSYIVFEYLSHGLPRMAVFCNRRHEARHRHVFIDSPYREDLFMDLENGQILPAHSLLSRLNGAGIEYKTVDTTQQYRQILLDGTVPRAYHFSMCPRNSRMSKLTPLFTGMFKRDVQFADLSKVIQEYAMDKLDDDARQILENFSVHRDHLTATLTQYDAYQALEKARPESDELGTMLDEYSLTSKKLSALVLSARDRKTDLEISIRSLEQANSELEDAKNTEETAHNQAVSELDDRKRELAEKRGPVATQIEAIERNKDSYDRQNIPEWREKLAGIDQLIGRHESYSTQLRTLSEKSERVRQPIEHEMGLAKDRYQTEIERLNKRFSELTSQYQTDRNAITQRHTKEVRELSNDQQKALSALQKHLLELNGKSSRAAERLKHPQATQDLIRQHEIAEQAKERAQSDFDTAQDDLATAVQNFNQADSRYKIADERFGKARSECEKLEHEHADVLGLINGDETSLIYFLNENKPGWENTLGRVLQPNILRQKNLTPELDEEAPDNQSLCGINLDFSRLPEQELTPAELQARLEELSEELVKAEEEEAAAEKALGKANTDRDTAKDRMDGLKSSFKKIRGALKDARDTLDTIRTQKLHSERENQAATERELEELEAQTSEIDEQISDAEERHNAEFEALTEQHEQELEAFDQTHRDALDAIERGKQEAEETRNQDLERLQKQLNQALSGEDIDPEEMDALGRKIEDLKAEIEKIRSKEIMVNSYETFMTEDYALLPELKQTLAGFDDQIKKLRDDRSSAVTNWQRRSKELDDQIDANSKDITQAGTDLNALQVSVLQTSEDRDLFVKEDDDSLALYREMRPSNLITEYQTLLQRESSKINDLKKLGARFATIFEKYTGTPSTQYWQEAELDWDGTAAQVITRARAILEYFRGGKHDMVRETLISGFSNLDQIDIYRRAMEGFDQRIRRFNRELSGHIQQNLNFPAIERVEPTVSFELQELDYWKDIKSLADGVRAWREDSALNSLPDDDLVITLRSYLETFEESRANVSVKELWRLIRFRFSIIENGKQKTGSSSKDLAGSDGLSSNGLSYIVLIVMFLGFVDMQRKGQPVHLSWALDELRAFSNKNKRVLLDLLADHNISLVTACPDMEDRELSIFNRVYMMERFGTGRRFVRWMMPTGSTAVAANNPFKESSSDEMTTQGGA